MMQHRLAPCIAAIVAALACVAMAQDAAQAAPPGWLAGCWKSDTDEAGSGEQWMAPAAGVMLGMSRTLRGGRMATHEFMRIAPGADGRLAFHAQPGGKPPESFPVRVMAPGEAVFENPAHDFPQRIIYRLQSPTRLLASIEGVRNGVARKIDFPMTRVACDAAQSP